MTTVVKNGRVYGYEDGVAGFRLADVVVDDAGVIAQVGDVSVPVGDDITVVDASGGYVVPGLIDMHAHVIAVTEAEARFGETVETLTEQTLRAATNLTNCLERGVTTIREVGAGTMAIFQVRDAVRSGRFPGPRIFTSGIGLAVTGGHGAPRMAREADGPLGMRVFVRRQITAGAEWIKLMATGGVGDEHEEISDIQISLEEMQAVVDEAHRWRRRVTAHIGTSEAAQQAMDAGLDCIEHGLILDEATVHRLAETGTYYCPTVEVYRRLGSAAPDEEADFTIDRSKTILESHDEAVKMARAAGVKIVAGTDSGMYPWPLGNVAAELEHLVRCGLSPFEAIDAATTTAAECLGVRHRLGAIEPGLAGDFFVVEADPSDAITALRTPSVVIQGGRIVA